MASLDNLSELPERSEWVDPITRLPGRILLLEYLGDSLAVARKRSRHCSLLHLDLEHLHEVNESFGYRWGDAVLAQVGERLRAGVPAGAIAMHLGGGNFGVLLPEVEQRDAAAIAQQLHYALSEPFLVDGQRLALGLYIGLAAFPTDGDTVDALLLHAEAALDAAKRSHTGVAAYSPRGAPQTKGRMILASELRQALRAGNQLTLQFQPQIHLTTGELSGVEALIRWNHPRFGLLSPGHFIGLAEESGLILGLTQWVLETAVAQAHAWSRTPGWFPISVNLSVHSLQDLALPEQLDDLLARWQVAPSQIHLEVTESAVMEDADRSLEILSRLHRAGIRIAIDDFGTGYSSLSYLRRLPIEVLKIDQSFVRDMATDENDLVLARSIVDLGHNLGLQVIAEGVEDRATWDLLTRLRCDSAQGYYISHPLTAAEFARWLPATRWTFQPPVTAVPATATQATDSYVLVVDDTDSVRETLSEVLRDSGYQVESVANGYDALNVVRERRPAVILLDMRMPGMSGQEVARALQEMGARDLPIVVMTAAAQAPQAAEEVAAAGFLPKPFDISTLLRTVRTFMSAAAL